MDILAFFLTAGVVIACLIGVAFLAAVVIALWFIVRVVRAYLKEFKKL